MLKLLRQKCHIIWKKGLPWHITRSMTDDRHFFGNFPSWSLREDKKRSVDLLLSCLQEGNPRWGGSASAIFLYCCWSNFSTTYWRGFPHPRQKIIYTRRYLLVLLSLSLSGGWTGSLTNRSVILPNDCWTKSHPVSFSSRCFLFVKMRGLHATTLQLAGGC